MLLRVLGLVSCPNHFLLWLQVTKALVLRYHPLSSCLTDRVSPFRRQGNVGPKQELLLALFLPETTVILLPVFRSLLPIYLKALFFQLMGLLSDSELGPKAADGFSLLMSDCTDVLTRAGHADVRIMFRQRFFTDNVPALVQGFHAAPQGKETLKGRLQVYKPLLGSGLILEDNLGPRCYFRVVYLKG